MNVTVLDWGQGLSTGQEVGVRLGWGGDMALGVGIRNVHEIISIYLKVC